MIPIAICVNWLLGHYVGGFRMFDDNGIGTDGVLFCESPVRRSRAAAIADAILTITGPAPRP